MYKIKSLGDFITESEDYFDDKTPLPSGWITFSEFKKLLRAHKDINNYYSEPAIKVIIALHEEKKIPMMVRMYRTAWNYGGHICVTGHVKGYEGSIHSNGGTPFMINTGTATHSGGLHFGEAFEGLYIEGDKIRTDTVYRSNKTDLKSRMELIDKVLEAYKRHHGKEFNIREWKKEANLQAIKQKAWAKWKTNRFKLYDTCDKHARKLGVKQSRPTYNWVKNEVHWYNNEPRELRHPDEYNYTAVNSKEYEKYQDAHHKLYQALEAFAKKVGAKLQVDAER